MLSLKLIRVTQDLSSPQRGVLLRDGEPFLVTLELPWKDNQKNVSCITEGEYEVRKVFNHHTVSGRSLPISFELLDVANRDGILIHPGNTILDTKGCICVGMYFGHLSTLPAVIESQKAFEKLLEAAKDNSGIKLEITRGC